MASGGILIYMSTRSPGSGGSSILAGQEAGLCTADTDRSLARLSDSAGSITYRKRRLVGDVTTSQSADLSKGNGFLAASIDGEFVIQDADGLIAADIEAGYVNPVGWDVWTGYIPAGGTYFDIIRLSQAKTIDLSIGEGCIRFALKSPAYLGNQPLHGTRTVSQLDTDPVDPSNPTNPEYLATSNVVQFSGVAMGSRSVSLKASSQIPIETLAYYDSTNVQVGDISSNTNPIAKVARTTTEEFSPVITDGLGNVVTGAGILLKCRVADPLETSSVDPTEVTRFIALLNTFIAAGYRIILSDGNWSMDTRDAAYSGYINFPMNHIEPATGGAAFGAAVIPKNIDRPYAFGAVWFNLCDADGYALYPSEGIDAASVKVYAVKASISTAAQQVIIDGFASDGKTIPANFEQTYVGGVTVINPLSSTIGGFYLCQSVPVSLLVNVTPMESYQYGATYWNKLLSAHTIAGDPADVNTVPGAYVPDFALTISGNGTADLSDSTLSVKLWLNFQEVAGSDMYSVDLSYRLSAGGGGGVRGFVKSSYWPDSTRDWYSGTSGFTRRVSAKTLLTHPIWRKTIRSTRLAELSPDQAILKAGMHSTSVGSISLGLDISELFVWAFRSASFSQLYSVIYPFWTRKTIPALATDGTGTVLAGGAGLGVASSDGSIAWTPFDIAPNANGAATIKGAAYGALTWVQVGYRTPDGSTFTNCFWHSTDGINWTEGTFPISAGIALCVRYVGGYFVCLYSNGTWKHSADGAAWTDHASIAGELNGVAYDGARWHFVGSSSFVAWTASLTSPSFTSYGAGSAAVTCIQVISGFGPTIDCVVVGHPGGVVSRCPLSSLSSGSWTDYALGGTAWITDIGKNGIGLMAISVQGAWFSVDGANWTATQFDHLAIGSNPVIANTQVDSESIWIVGADAQIVTARNRTPLTWIPWGTRTPSEGLANIVGRYFGGMALLVYGGNAPSVNPVQWNEPFFSRSGQSWGVAFDPPSDAISGGNGANADAAARKIAQEWWIHAGEMSATRLDGSNDPIEEGFPEIALGNIEDVATIITVQYAPFGGDYLKLAYIQNVDVDRATAGKPDEFFFKGWDATGNFYGLAIWTACRAAYLKTQILRATSLSFDSVHDEATLGAMWNVADTDIGQRIQWLCSRPQYLRVTVNGNDSQAVLAQCGCRYKPNFAMLNARGLPTLGPTGYGIVVQADHNYTQGLHTLDVAFPPA